jgi:hypothetical protein
VATAAAANRVEVISIIANTALPAALGPPTHIRLDERPLTLSLHGTFAHVLDFVHAIDQSSLAARIGIDSIGTIERPAARTPTLNVALRIVLLHAPRVAEAQTVHGPL